MESGLGGLGDDELVGVLRAARRLESWQAGVGLAVVAELDARRRAQAARPGWSGVSEHVSAELAAALALTGRSADELLGFSRGLDRLPAVRAALLAGRIDRARSMVFTAELSLLGDLAAAMIAAAFADVAGSMTTGQLRAALRQMVLMADPDAVRRRAEAGRAGARVERWAEGSGNATLAGRELPPAEVIVADARLTAIAKALQAAGAAGTLDQLRAAVYTALLTGRDPETLLPAPGPAAGATPSPAGPGGTGRAGGPSGAAGPGAASDRDDSDGNAASGRDHDNPRHSAGDNDADGNNPRHSAADNGASGDNAHHSAGDTCAGGDNAHHSDTGHSDSVHHSAGGGDESERAGPGQAAAPRPGALAALNGSLHLIMPASAWLGQTDAPGEVTGYGPLDADACRDLATRLAVTPGTRWCVTLTGPDGRAAAHACARHGPSPPGPGTAGMAEVTRWLAGLRVAWLESGACGHARQAAGYRPGPLLSHLITVRQRTCSFPGCRRPARRCDQDHTISYDQGGRTCECNLAPLCRQHHRAKQAPGWHLAQPQPGILAWTPPHGRTYTVTPQPYPA
jgi:hypothetical protein